LSGGIGAGKSAVSGLLRERGAVVVDADALAREVVAAGTPGLGAVVAAFGEDLLLPDGNLDRPALGQRVFADPDARRRLEQIVHPLVGQRTGELLATAPADAIVVHDVPLLVEKRMGPAYHLVVIVGAPAATRVDRLVTLRGMSEADARSRLDAQADDEARRAAADVWLDNSGDLAGLAAQVEALWQERLLPYEQNLRTRRPAPLPTEPVPHDPEWPRQAARLAARLELVTGGRVEQTGPAVAPDALAPDVLDLELSLPGADNAQVVLADAGFPAVGDRRHASADPGRPARLRVVPATG
jgi:dephospho-CoA kinase